MEIIHTSRLTLRPWAIEDARDLFAYASSPVIGPAAGWRPHESMEESENVIRMFLQQNDGWAIALKHVGKVIGSVGLHRDAYRPDVNARMLGYVLSDKYWGHGLATEAARAATTYAFESLGLDLLSAYHYPHNSRSKRVLEKCGFVWDGELRRAIKVYNGRIYNAVCYSMTQEEYAAQPWLGR